MATNVGSLFVDLGLDLKGFDKGMSDALSSLSGFDSKISNNASKIGNNIGNNIGSGIGSGIGNKVNDAEKRIEEIGKDVSQIRSSGERIGKEIGEGINSGLDKSILDMGSKLFNGMESIGKKGMKFVTAPIIAGATYLNKLDSDVTDTIAKVSILSDRDDLVLKKEAIALSNMRGIDVHEIGEAQYTSLSSGIKDEELGAFLQEATMMSRVGFADLDTAVDGLTTTLNSYGLEAREVGRISNELVIAQELGKFTFGELASSMGNVTPLASELNVNTKELFSSIATLTKSGVPATKSITSLRAAFSGILKPNEKAIETAKALGIEFNSAHLKSVGWAKFLKEIKEKTGGSEQALSNLFGSVDALNAMMVLTGKGAGTFSEAMSNMENSSGRTQEAYDKLLTSGELFRMSLNRLKNALTVQGGVFEELRDKVTSAINKIVEVVEKITPEQAQTIAEVAGAFAMFFPAIFIVGKLGGGLLSLINISNQANTAMLFMGGGAKELALGMLGVFSKIMIVVGALGAFIYMLWNAEDESAVQAESIGDKFASLVVRMEGFLQMMAGFALMIVGLYTTAVTTLIVEAMSKLSEFVGKAGDIADSLGADWLAEKFRDGAGHVKDASNFLKDANSGYLDEVKKISEGADMKMNSAFTVVQTRKVEKGKIDLPKEMIGSDIYDKQGYLTDKAMLSIADEEKKRKKRELEFDFDFSDGFEFPELETPEGFNDGLKVDTSEIDKILEGLDKKDKAMKKTGKTVKTETEKMAEAIKKLGDEFRNTSDSIKGSIGMFDRFKSKTTNSYRLLRNARERNRAINERETTLASLSNRGISQDIMAELYETGIDQLGDIRGLNRLSDNQLQEWVNLQVSASDSANRQAVEQVVNITVNAAGKEREAEDFANEIFRRLKRRGITIY